MSISSLPVRRRASDQRRRRPIEPAAAGPVGIADLLHSASTDRTRIAALIFVAVFIAATFAVGSFAAIHGPIARPILPIFASLWGAAELLTAYLLLSQFAVNGVRAFLVLGAAYAIAGLLAIPYLGHFPGVFLPETMSLPNEQISAWLWVSWHLTFPILVGAYYLVDRQLTARVVDSAEIRGNLTLAVLLVIAVTFIITGLMNAERDALPYLVVHARFTSLFRHVVAPLLVIVNACAAILVVAFSKRPSRLQVWLAVALAVASLETGLDAVSPARFTIAWSFATFESLITASVVLVILLSEVGAMYRRLGTMAMLDALTGLRNRRAFDDYIGWVLRRRRASPSELSFMVLDVDYFKGFNDRYGHAIGDICLRRIANSIVDSLHRDLDIAARFGGEEFIVLLPETGATAAEHVAERIRRAVEAMQITHGASTVYSAVTVSIGVAYVDATMRIDKTTLFAIADHALYQAKERRNCTVVVPYKPDDPGLLAAVPHVLAAAD